MPLDKEDTIEFWKWSRLLDPDFEYFWKEASALQDGTFPQFCSYLEKNELDLYENFTIDVSSEKEVLIKFWEVIQ